LDGTGRRKPAFAFREAGMTSRLYHNPRCSKSRGALELLRERGIEPRIMAYLDQPPSIAELQDLLRMLGTGARSLLRDGEPEYTELGLSDASLDEDALIAAMAAHPRLIERPVFVHNGRAVIGRPPERVLELL
jgi:arsenate reductase (glutaredoxin)